MNTIISGTIRGGTIQPDFPLALPEGATVSIAILAQEQNAQKSASAMARRMRNCFGSLSDLPQEDWDDLDSIIAVRKEASFREVEE